MWSPAAVQRACGSVQAAFRPPAGARMLTAGRRGCSVVCMAHPRRVAKVAKQIEREVGNLLITDKILQAAVCPERRRGYDGALSALASVTEVAISNDLQVAKVYVSLYSDEPGKAVAMEGLQRLEGYVRKHVGKQIRLRLTPEIRFVRDDSIERSERIFKLLDQVKQIERGEAEPPPLAFHGDLEEEEEEEEEEEDDSWSGELNIVDLFAEPAAASSSGRAAAGGPAGGTQQPAQQQRQGGGKQKQQRQQQQQKRGEKGEGGSGEEDPELAAVLEEFKRQVQRRSGHL